MKTYLLQKDFLLLNKELRDKLVATFAINKSVGVNVMNNILVSDGCSQQDLIAGLTIGKMIEFLGNSWKKVDNDKLYDSLLTNVITKINETKKPEIKQGGTETPGTKESENKGIANEGKGNISSASEA